MTKMTKEFNKGFGLLEVLVSSSIIIMVLSSVVFIGRQAIVNSTYLQQRAQAIYLAQEGLESVRQIRDTNWIDRNSDTEWNYLVLTGSTYSVPSNGNYILKYESFKKRTLLNKDTTPSGELINLDKQDFNRFIKVENITSSASILPEDGLNITNKAINSMKVTVEVKWTNGGVERKTNVSEILTNWRPGF